MRCEIERLFHSRPAMMPDCGRHLDNRTELCGTRDILVRKPDRMRDFVKEARLPVLLSRIFYRVERGPRRTRTDRMHFDLEPVGVEFTHRLVQFSGRSEQAIDGNFVGFRVKVGLRRMRRHGRSVDDDLHEIGGDMLGRVSTPVGDERLRIDVACARKNGKVPDQMRRDIERQFAVAIHRIQGFQETFRRRCILDRGHAEPVMLLDHPFGRLAHIGKRRARGVRHDKPARLFEKLARGTTIGVADDLPALRIGRGVGYPRDLHRFRVGNAMMP